VFSDKTTTMALWKFKIKCTSSDKELCANHKAKARQVLMKKLGFMEDRSLDDALLGYFTLFGGPLSGTVIQALTALCGLGDDSGAGCSQA